MRTKKPSKPTPAKKRPADLTQYALRKLRREVQELHAAVKLLQVIQLRARPTRTSRRHP